MYNPRTHDGGEAEVAQPSAASDKRAPSLREGPYPYNPEEVTVYDEYYDRRWFII